MKLPEERIITVNVSGRDVEWQQTSAAPLETLDKESQQD